MVWSLGTNNHQTRWPVPPTPGQGKKLSGQRVLESVLTSVPACCVSWAEDLTPLSFCFFISKMAALCICQGCWEQDHQHGNFEQWAFILSQSGRLSLKTSWGKAGSPLGFQGRIGPMPVFQLSPAHWLWQQNTNFCFCCSFPCMSNHPLKEQQALDLLQPAGTSSNLDPTYRNCLVRKATCR